MSRTIHYFLLSTCLLGLTYSDLRNGNCQKLGTLCSDDNRKVLLCTEIDKPSIDIGDCDEKDQCKMVNETAQCVDMTKVTLQFECSEKGEFPDPGNCEQTYICNSDRGKPSEVCKCPEGRYVNPEEGLHCVEPECPRKPITCEEGATNHFELTNGAKTSFLYYCKSADSATVYAGVDQTNRAAYRAALFKMANRKHCIPYDLNTSSSISDTTSSTPISTSSPSSTTSSPSTTSSELPNASTEAPQKCTIEGETFPTECDCDYLRCDSNLKPIRKTCFSGRKYNKKMKICIIGECDESKCTGRPKSF